MSETVTAFGQIVAVRESAVATRVAGIVNDVPVQVGSVVAEGDVLAQMDTERLRIELASAEAALALATAGLDVALAQVERAEKALERAQRSPQTAASSGVQVEDRASALVEAQGGLAQARARIATAQSAVDLVRYNLDNTTVRAPFDGIVLDVSTQDGQFAASGSPVARLLDISQMEIEANVPARYIQALETGRTVYGRNDAGTTLTLSLRAVLPTEFAETRTRPVRFVLTELDPTFAIGQPVALDVPVGAPREVLAVPKDALVQGRGGWTAYVNDDGKASPRTVSIGASIGDTFEVLSGLAPGDEVVVRGNERLRPGQAIAPMGAGSGRPPGGGGQAGAGGGGQKPSGPGAGQRPATESSAATSEGG